MAGTTEDKNWSSRGELQADREIHAPGKGEYSLGYDLPELDPGQSQGVHDLISKWSKCFSKHEFDLGRVTAMRHEIPLMDETPCQERYRRIPPSMYEEVKQHIKEMLNAGVIRGSSSPWASPVVLARKPDGSLRFCIDFRKLNSRTIPDAFPLPRIEETLDTLQGAQWYSSLDLKSGYWQLEIREEDKPKTAFTMGPLGFYECNVLPFGCSGAPATFQRLMHRVMGDLNLTQCLVYLDDIIVFSDTFEEHIQRLEAVFARLAEYGLKLKPTKCKFFQRRIKYLGHIISSEGIETDPDKTEAVAKWPAPTNIKELRRFLGFTGYYRKFVRDYAKVARPLHDLLVGVPRKGKGGKKTVKWGPAPVWKWAHECQEAFEELIRRLTSPPVLAFADFTEPFIVHTDASLDGLGAILYQKQAGHERVIAYASRGLSGSERRYPVHKLEFLALKWAVTDKFHDYLYGNRFVVRTDNNPLTYALTTAKLDATGHRWLAALGTYNFCIEYRAGRANADADGLSRRDTAGTIEHDSVQIICQQASLCGTGEVGHPWVESLCLNMEAIPDAMVDPPSWPGTAPLPVMTRRDWIREQQADEAIGWVIYCKAQDSKPAAAQKNAGDRDISYASRMEQAAAEG